MNFKWELYEEVDHEARKQINHDLQIPDIITRVLLTRGLKTPQQIRAFFRPSFDNLRDPMLMKDMEKAVDRTIEALINKERIFIYGDYDVDGITSVSMLYLFLKDMGGIVRYYIPDRQTEGYGISQLGIQEAVNWKANLIISVDCGVTSIDEVNFANESGLDVIISDHHEPGETLPNALAVLDPKRRECEFPFKELAGVGVAYKIAQGISEKWDLDSSSHDKYIDLVAIGSAADIVPLIDENRILVKHGLEKINTNCDIGLNALIEIAGLKDSKINVGHIIFVLAPRINAVGRLGSASVAVELLTTRDSTEAHRLAQNLEEENRRRKSIDNLTLKEAHLKITSEYDPENDKAIVLWEQAWHPGVIGIVASRIIEQYYRPTIMITIEDGVGKGSARSIPGFDIYSALKKCSHLLMQFGGHKYAAGLTIEEGNIEEFAKLFKDSASELISDEDLVRKIEISSEISLSEITKDVIRYLEYFEPYGPKNPKPLFVSRNVEVVYPRLVGNQHQHLRFKAKQDGYIFDVIGFNMSEKFDKVILDRQLVDIVYSVEKNEWMNRVTTQLLLKDIH